MAAAKWTQKTIVVPAKTRGCHLITPVVTKEIEKDLVGFRCGLAHLFLQHISASLTINENYDSDVLADTETFLNDIVPEGKKARWRHTMEGADDMPTHIKSSMFGCSVTPYLTSNVLVGFLSPMGISTLAHGRGSGSMSIVTMQLSENSNHNARSMMQIYRPKKPLKECKIANKYGNIKSTIDSGLSVLRVNDKFVETTSSILSHNFGAIVCIIINGIVAISYPTANLKKSVNYFSVDILSFINKEPERIIVIYDEDEYAMTSAGNLFFEKGVDNIFVLHGGLKEVVNYFSYMLEGQYPKPFAPVRPISNTNTNGKKSVLSSKSSTPNWVRKNKESCSALSTPTSKSDKPARPRPGWGFPPRGPMSVSYSDTSSSQRGFSPIKR